MESRALGQTYENLTLSEESFDSDIDLALESFEDTPVSYMASQLEKRIGAKTVPEQQSPKLKDINIIQTYISNQDGTTLNINLNSAEFLYDEANCNIMLSIINTIPFNEISRVNIRCGSYDDLRLFTYVNIPILRALERVKEVMGDKISIVVYVSPIAELLSHIFISVADEVIITTPTIIMTSLVEAKNEDLKMFLNDYAMLIKNMNILTEEQYNDEFLKHKAVEVDVEHVIKTNPKFKLQ